MGRTLIVNADDFGLNKGQNCSIAEACRNGVVASATALVNGAATDYTVQLDCDIPALAIEMHFALTFGRPLTAVPDLVHDRLLGKWIRQITEEDTSPLDEISQELAVRYQCFIGLFGREPTHLGSHRHIYVFPQIFPIVTGFAVEKRIVLHIDRQTVFRASDFPETLCTSQGLSSEFCGEAISEALLLQILDASADRRESSPEVTYHPAFTDDIIRQGAYCYPHLTKLGVLTSSSLKYTIAKHGYRLGSLLNA